MRGCREGREREGEGVRERKASSSIKGLSWPGFVDQESPRPPQARVTHHPEEARPVFRHVQLRVHVLQEPPEVLTLEPCPELLPLGHIPKGFLRKQQKQ